MLKVIRKYNKWILAIGGTLLLIAFLMPQAISQLGNARSSRTVATLDGRNISAAEFQTAVAEVAALQQFFGFMDRRLPLPLDERNEVEHWLLLRTEAEGAGMVGGALEGETLLPVFADALVRGVYMERASQFGASAGQFAEYMMANDPEGVQTLTQRAMEILATSRVRAAGAAQLTGQDFDMALARLQGISRLISSYQRAERISDRQTRSIAKTLADSALVDAVFLSARELADEEAAPTLEQLRAHFERFKELRRGEGEFGIGYKLPNRVKVEWLELDRPGIEEAVEISVLDANKHWQLNRDIYTGEFEEESERVIRDLRRARVDQILNAAVSLVRSEIGRAMRSLERDEDYRVLPDDWDEIRPGYGELADRIVEVIQETEGVTIPRPRFEVRAAEWLDARALSELPGIGISSAVFGGNRGTFSQFALSVRELAGDSILALQQGVPAIDLVSTGPGGSRYIYTILDTAEEAVAESIDELLDQEQIVEDWRALTRYEELVESIPAFESAVIADGLEAFAASFGTLPLPEDEETNDATEDSETEDPAEDPAESNGAPADEDGADQTGEDQAADEPGDEAGDEGADESTSDADDSEPEPEPQQRVTVTQNARVFENRTERLGQAENDENVIAAVLARSREIDPRTPIDDVALDTRVVSSPVPSRLGVVVAQINGVQPLTNELLPAYADGAQNQRWRETVGTTGFPYPFQYDAISRRHTFTLRGGGDDADAPAEPVEADAAEADEPAEPQTEDADG